MAAARAKIAPLGGWIRFFHWLCRNLFRAFFRYQREGGERIPRTGAVLVVANHASFLDPVLVGAVSNRPLRYLARSTLFRGVLGAAIRAFGAVPVEREGVGIGGSRMILSALASGECVLMFPEGTRSRDGRLGKLRVGAIRIAQRSGAPIVPVWIDGSHRAWPRGAKLPRPAKISVRVGEPYRVPGGADPAGEVASLREKFVALSGATQNEKHEPAEDGPPGTNDP